MIALVLSLLMGESAFGGLPACRSTSALVRPAEAFAPALQAEGFADVGEPVLVARQYSVHIGSERLKDGLEVSGQTSRAPFTLRIPSGTEVFREPEGLRVIDYEFTGRGRRPTDVHITADANGSPVARMSWGWFKERHAVSGGSFGLEQTECFLVRSDALTRQISFTGVSRGVISLEYREFSGDLARQAFTQSVSYDLSDGGTIGFRGARIEVISADNTGIRYRVLKPFD